MNTVEKPEYQDLYAYCQCKKVIDNRNDEEMERTFFRLSDSNSSYKVVETLNDELENLGYDVVDENNYVTTELGILRINVKEAFENPDGRIVTIIKGGK